MLLNVIVIRKKPHLHLLSTHVYVRDYKTSFVNRPRQLVATRAFNNVWKKEKRRHWLFLRDKRKRRVNFLSEKFGSKGASDCVTEVEGITVADQPTPSTFSSSPRCYGGVQLTSDEEKVLCLPPKFAIYDRVDLTSC